MDEDQDDVITTTTSSTTHAYLEWSGDLPAFCNNVIYFDLRKLKATPETVCSIFGLRDPDSILLDGCKLQEENGERFWPVEAGLRYRIALVKGYYFDAPCSINDIFALIGSEDRIHQLSLAFYSRIWKDDDNDDFRSHFTRSVSSPQEAADNQARWLIEIWGGKKRYSQKHGETKLLKRVLAKHSSKRRMSFENAKIWLNHMKAVVSQEFKDCPKEVKNVLGLYWAHFFAFFPFNESERSVIREMTSTGWVSA